MRDILWRYPLYGSFHPGASIKSLMGNDLNNTAYYLNEYWVPRHLGTADAAASTGSVESHLKNGGGGTPAGAT